MKKLHYLILAACMVIPQTLHAQFEEVSTSTRSTALGGMFTHVADDASALFINSAGLVNSASPVLYGDFSESSAAGYGSETMIAAIYPAPWITVGAGWFRRGLSGGDIDDENVFIAGIAKKLLTNTGGSYLSVGAAMKAGRLAYGSSCDCPAGGSSESDVTGDLGLILRPLPVISIGYSLITLKEVDFGDYGSAQDIGALTLFLPFGRAVCRALIGAVSLKPALKDIGALLQATESEIEAAEVAVEPEEI